MANPKQIANMRVSALHVNSTTAALFVHTVDASGAFVSPGAGSTQVSIKEILSSSGGSLIDSSNVSLGVTIRAGSAAGTEYTDGDVDATISGSALLFDNSSNTLRPVTLTRGLPVNIVAGSAASTQVSIKEMLTSSGGSILDSTVVAMRVNQVGYAAPSTTVVVSGVVRSTNSVAADFLATVSGVVRSTNSVAADLLATVIGTVRSTNSVAADFLATVSGLVRSTNSVAADLQVTATQTGTWNVGTVTTVTTVSAVTTVSSVAGVLMSRLQDSSGVGIVGSTGPTAIGVNGLVTREVMPSLLSTRAVITSSNSTALYTLVSSAANPLRHKVFAYSLTSTETTPSTIVFYSSNTIDRWAVSFGSGSSGISGANLTVTPPAWLFCSDANNALRCLIEKAASTQCIATLSIAYFTEA